MEDVRLLSELNFPSNACTRLVKSFAFCWADAGDRKNDNSAPKNKDSLDFRKALMNKKSKS